MFVKPRTEPLNSRRRLGVSIVVLVALLLIGSVGFYLLSDDGSAFDAVYLTTLILTTVGMKGRLELNTPQQAWALFMMLAGISAALYAAGNVFAFIIDGELQRLFGRQQLQNKIDHLQYHYIVCGFGPMGQALCAKLNEKNAPFLLIEHSDQRTTEAHQQGYLHLQGDAMSEDTLKAAHIERARGLATCLSTDADNVFVTLTARGLNDKLTIIARANEPTAQSKLKRAGANRIICLPLLGATRITHMLLQPGIDELLDLTVTGRDLEITKINIDQIPTAAGKSLRDLALPQKTSSIVVAIIHPDGQRTFNPPPDTQVGHNDEMIIISPAGGVDKIMDTLSNNSS